MRFICLLLVLLFLFPDSAMGEEKRKVRRLRLHRRPLC